MSELGWGILSTARIARTAVIPGIMAAARCRVVAIASRDAERARSVAAEMGIPRAHGSYEALLADPAVDAVYIPLPNHLHAEWAMAAARAGKHVLCEKPLALTVTDAERMIEVAEGEGVQLMEAFMYRLHPSWIAITELVASGPIGRLTAVQSWFSYFNDDPTNIRNIREFGGGALFDIGCYNVNLSRMLFGAEPGRIEASITRDPATGVDVLASAILEFDRGVATFTCAIRAEDDQRVHIYGTEGRIDVDIPFNIPADRPTTIRLSQGGDPPVDPATQVYSFEPADPYTAQASAFTAAVLDGTPIPVPPADAVANLRALERIFEAAERRPGDHEGILVQP